MIRSKLKRFYLRLTINYDKLTLLLTLFGLGCMLCICFKFTENDVSLIKSIQVVNKEMTDNDVSINCRHVGYVAVSFIIALII